MKVSNVAVEGPNKDMPAHGGKSPRFAVCLAAYNGMAFIEEQVESILTQRHVDVQIFVSVDLSTDGTQPFMAEWASRDARLTLLPYGERFGGAGPNFYRIVREIDLTGFDYLSFADQDDRWQPEKLWRAHALMEAQGARAYSSNFTAYWATGESHTVNKAFPQRTWDFMFESAGPGCTYVLQANLAQALQKMICESDSTLARVDYHDWLVYAFARFYGFPWVIDSWSSMDYRQHANNQVGVNVGWRSFWMRVRKILSGYGFEQSLLIADTINASALPVVRWGLRGGRLGYLRMALSAAKCRRRPKDQVLFFVSCLLLAVAKPAPRGSA